MTHRLAWAGRYTWGRRTASTRIGYFTVKVSLAALRPSARMMQHFGPILIRPR